MFDYENAFVDSATYWKNQPSDNPYTVNGFNGTWNISDHSLIPCSFNNFLSEYYYNFTRLSRVPIEDINALLNEIWEGPGSMVKVELMTSELRTNRLKNMPKETKDVLKGYDTPTIDSELSQVFDDE